MDVDFVCIRFWICIIIFWFLKVIIDGLGNSLLIVIIICELILFVVIVFLIVVLGNGNIFFSLLKWYRFLLFG